jgi:hypothetical protein
MGKISEKKDVRRKIKKKDKSRGKIVPVINRAAHNEDV